MYPPRLIKEPLIWQISEKFNVVTNIRQASVTDEIGIVCLEVDGKRENVKAAIKWLEKIGVKVEPVEISVIEIAPRERRRIPDEHRQCRSYMKPADKPA